MKKPIRKPYWIYNETYRVGFYFCPGFSEKELASTVLRLAKYKCNQDDYDYLKTHSGMKWNIVNLKEDIHATFLWVKDAGLNHETLDTLSHEAFHLVSEIYRTHGLKHDLDNDEAGAYLMGWIIRKCVRCLEEEGK